MIRSLKFNLNLSNMNKKKQLDNLWVLYKQTIQDYLDRLFSNQDLSEDYIKSYNNQLSYRYKQCAKRQSFKIFKCWCRNKKKGEKPIFNGAITLDNRFISVQDSKNSFDYWIKISTSEKGKPILVPVKSYNYANKYFGTWTLIKGGKLIKTKKGWSLILSFEKETYKKKNIGKFIGIDIGIKKLIVDSDGKEYGKNIERLMDKIQRKQQGSKAFERALKERDCYINKTVKELPFKEMKIIAMENIKDIKKNTKKEKRLNKQFRSKFQRWTYSKLISRVEQLSEVAGVQCLKVAPAFTSQTCNRCGFVHKLNRNGEIFKCKNCGYTLDADFNASLNILNLGLAQQSMVAGNIRGNICL